MAQRNRALHLQLVTDSIYTNSVLLNGVKAFSVETDDAGIASKCTIIRDLRAGGRQATIKDGVFSKTVAFQGARDGLDEPQVVKVSNWLTETKSEDGFPVHLMTVNDSKFVWKKDPVHRLILYPFTKVPSVDDDLTAYLQLSPSSKSFVIQEGMSSWIVEILAAYIILESKLRAKEESPRTLGKPSSAYVADIAYMGMVSW